MPACPGLSGPVPGPCRARRPGEEVVVGRHTAPDGESVHPVIAEALARRPAVGAHRDEGSHRDEGPLGWPGEPPARGTGGLGWPGDLAPTAPVAPVRDLVEDTIKADTIKDDAPDD